MNKINRKAQEVIFFRKRLDKKAQEEIVGFVLIVVLVAVIAVIFLGISLRNPEKTESPQSEQVASFLSAVGEITTDCEIPESSPKTISQLVVRCAEGAECINHMNQERKTSCEVLENYLKGALEASYLIGEGSFVKYYNLSIYYASDKEAVIESIIKGVDKELNGCLGRKLINNRPFTSTGIGANSEQIIMELEVCYNR